MNWFLFAVDAPGHSHLRLFCNPREAASRSDSAPDVHGFFFGDWVRSRPVDLTHNMKPFLRVIDHAYGHLWVDQIVLCQKSLDVGHRFLDGLASDVDDPQKVHRDGP